MTQWHNDKVYSASLVKFSQWILAIQISNQLVEVTAVTAVTASNLGRSDQLYPIISIQAKIRKMSIVFDELTMGCKDPALLQLATDLDLGRDIRAKSFMLDWDGPLVYDPLDYFSALNLLFIHGHMSSELIFRPWLVVMAACLSWTIFVQLYLKDSAPWILAALSNQYSLITILGGAISFLLAFRLARAAVRFYDARYL